MNSRPTQEELKAANHATLRAHATSDEAKALVARLAATVTEHLLATGVRKNQRKKTAEKLEYATGAFLANLLRPHGSDEPHGCWVYRSMHAKGFTGAAVSYRMFAQIVETLAGLALIDQVAGYRVSDEPGDTGKYAARFRATPALLRFCSKHGVSNLGTRWTTSSSNTTSLSNHWSCAHVRWAASTPTRSPQVGLWSSKGRP